MIEGSCKSDKPINITGIDKVHIKCDCIDGSIMNGARQPILYSFALDQPRSHNLYKEPRIKLFKKIKKKRVLSHETFYLEDDDYKPIDSIGKTISFTCQLSKIKKLTILTIVQIRIKSIIIIPTHIIVSIL